MRAQLGALIEEALERLPREPDLHAKRDLGRHALQDAEALDGLEAGGERAAAALALLERRHAHRPPPAISFYETDAVPARDPFVEVEPGGPPSELNDALVVAEAAATTAREAPDWPTKRALIALVAAKLDETAAIEAALEEPWGTHPVDVSGYERLLALPLGDRVQQLLGKGARGGEDAGV